MIRAICIFSLLITTTFVQAQFPFGGSSKPTLKGKIEGSLSDSISSEAIGFASFTLFKAGTATALDGVLSDEKGNFKFADVKTGKYDLVVSFLGYTEKSIKGIETTLKDPDLNIGSIKLSPADGVLQAVDVNAQKSLIENKVDRLVFNAENDASIAGGDATAVLRKVPLLTVDLNGNVSLRGSESVKILINGKPSGMFSNNVADALKMFPADQIKRVEVITSPSSKFDGEGSAGIINIVTKKANIEGIAASINASIGNRQNSLFANLNAGKGRLGITGSAAVFYSNPTDAINTFYREETLSAGKRIVSQSGTQNSSRLGQNGNVSLFYDFNGYNSINSSFNFRGFGFDMDGSLDGLITDPVSLLMDQFNRTNKGNNFFGGFDWNTDYTKKFEGKEDQELSLAFQYSKENNDQDFDIIEDHTELYIANRDAKITNDGNNQELTLQADYVHPIKNSWKLETGAKAVMRDIVSDYSNLNKNENGDYIAIADLTNIFDYEQNVGAAYASTNFILAKKYSFVVGTRYEHTTIKGDQRSGDFESFENSYGSLLPSFTVSRNFPGFKTLKLSYTKRIQRPSLQFINPFNNNSDYINRTIGNPTLKPENTNQIELSYNTNFLGFTIFSSVYYRLTQDIIEQTLAIDNLGLSINSYNNVGKNNAVGLNLFTSKNINQFTIRLGGNLFSYNATGVVNNVNLERKTYEYNLFASGEYSISGSWKADFFSFFKSPKRTLQGDNPAFSIYGMGVRKEFKQISLGITLIEPFQANKIFESNINGQSFVQTSSFSLPFRSVGVNFRYKFGSVDFKERKSKIKNTDLKSGEGEQGGGTTTQPGTGRGN